MVLLISSLIVILFFGLTLLYSRFFADKQIRLQKKARTTLFVFLAAFLLRIICALIYPGHETDMACFNSWSDMIFTGGFSSFYTSESFTDYPPGYMYILYVVGFFKNLLGLKGTLILKLPAILFDLLSAFLIFRISKRKNADKASLTIASFFLFNPAVIINSAVWGQTDSVYTFFVLLTLMLALENNLKSAYFSYAAAIFIKPQALFFAPVLIFAIIEQIILRDFSKKRLLDHLTFGVGALLSLVILSVPFGINAVIEQYTNTIASYNFASVNAYNFWTMIGLNWQELNPLMSAVGYFSIIVSVALGALIFFSQKSDERYFYSAAFICFSTFIMSVKMHDRYAFASIALMLAAFSLSQKHGELWLFAVISITQFLNAAHVLFYYDAQTYYSSSFIPIAVVLSAISVLVFIFLLLYTKKMYFPSSKTTIPAEETTKILPKVTKTDIIAISVITIIYAVIALYNLGDFKAPQSYATVNSSNKAFVDLGENKKISKLSVYLGGLELSSERPLKITAKNRENEEVYTKTLTDGGVYSWQEIKEIQAQIRYIEFSSPKNVRITEVGAFDGENQLTLRGTPQLVDEQNLVPERASYKNSTYFDEIYHARTANEFINRENVYEWTHPPLGKIFIAAGIKLFGMTPLGWRIAGTLFGILMIPFLYIFSKKMFGITWLSVCATLLFTFDFMHFAQTRIATIDVYVTFFILLMYLFMYKYISMSFYDKRAFIPLGLCGISMGLAIASKWTGIYAGAGLAAIFFVSLFERYRENRPEFKERAIKTIIFCVIFFVAVPVLIYIISYIPYMKANSTNISGVIQNQIDMFTYHGKTVVSSEHPYSSPWYQWAADIRPIWYYSGTNGSLSENISSFGNPIVWWTGIAALFYCIYSAIAKKDKNALFLSVAYFSQLVPWTFVTRTTFIYHFFPNVPFVVLMIGYAVSNLYKENKSVKKYAFILTALAVLAFIAFYPALSGFPANGDYVRTFLRWLPTWQLIG